MKSYEIGGNIGYGAHYNLEKLFGPFIIEANSQEEADKVAAEAGKHEVDMFPTDAVLNYTYAIAKKSIFNGTPHAINIVKGAAFNASIRKFTGGSVVRSIPSNGMLNAKMRTIELPDVDGIPCFGKEFIGVDELPQGYDIYIVSALYSSAAIKSGMDMSRIHTVIDPVYTEDGNSFIGCRGIGPAF